MLSFRHPWAFLASASLLFAVATLRAQSLNCLGTTASDNPAAREEVDRGVELYKNARYEEAISHFAKATDLTPCMMTARTYLATAQAQNVIPALITPDNLKTADQAIANFKLVLAQNPHDVNSLKQIASVYLSIKKLDEARAWQKKVLAEDPRDPEAAYTIGVIDWTQAHQHSLAALLAADLQDDGEGNVQAPPAVLESIKQQNQALVEEGLHYLTIAIEERPDYDDAMAYLNLVYRRKADIDYQTPSLRSEDVATAREWSRRAMATRKKNEQRRLQQPESSQPQ